jgi:hypothetical protein
MADAVKPSPLFVAVGQDGLRITSRDGRKWEHAQTGKEGETYRAVCWGNNRFAAVGSYGGGNILASSTDGVKWKTAFKDGMYSRYFRGLGFGKGIFLALGGDPGSVGNSVPFESHTTDGEAWSDYKEIAGKNILRRLAWGNDRFVGVGDRGRRAASADGFAWKDAADVRAIDTLVDVAFGKGVFVGVGLHGLRQTSEDGLKWTDRQVGEEGEHLNSVVWADDRFVAVGAGATYTSPDGRKWKREPNKDAPLIAAFGGGVFVGCRWRGRILRSTDGVQWEEVYKSEQHVEAFAFGSSA